MKKRALLAATAILWSAAMPIAPAFADFDEDGEEYTPGDNDLVGQPGEDAYDVCVRAMKPNLNSKFQTEVVDESDPELVSHVETGPRGSILSQTPNGDPTYANFTGFTNAHRNGSSPNVHAWGVPTSVVYQDGSEVTQETLYTDTYETTFGCRVWKTNPHGKIIEPPGLQTTGHTVSSVETGVAGTVTYDLPGPYSPPGSITGDPQEIVICISPNTGGKKPGAWRMQNDYDGSLGACATLSNSLTPSGDSLPNQNAPTS